MKPSAPAAGWTDPTCPVARAVDLVGDRWSLLIVRDAADGIRSFTAFQRSLGVARNVLADRLRKLVDAGVLERVTAPSGKRQEYVLTDAGAELFTTVVALRQWGEAHAFGPGERHSTLVADATGEPVGALRVPGGVGVADTHVERV